MNFNGTNYPTQLEINNMMASLDANNSVVKGCRFVVRINIAGQLTRLSYLDKVRTHLMYACDSAEFPGRGFQTSEVRYYGPKQQVPSNTLYGEGINLAFICRSDTMERQFFDDWMDIINPPTSYHFKFPADYWTDIEIFQYAEFGSLANAQIGAEPVKGIPRTSNPQNKFRPEPIYSWRLMKAWPTLVAPQQVTWADTDVLRLQVTFSYKNWIRQGDSEEIAKKLR
jgi:hypothetical protein